MIAHLNRILWAMVFCGCFSPVMAADGSDTVPAWNAVDTDLTAQAVEADLRVARAVLEEVHPGYDRYTAKEDLDTAWATLAVQAQPGLSLSRFYVALSELLTRIHCDHTKAELPEAMTKARTAGPTFFPFRFALFDGRAFVTDVTPDVPELQPGDEILKIQGRPFADLAEEIRSLVPVDGQTFPSRDPQLEATGEFLGSAFEHFSWLIQGRWDTADVTAVRDGAEPFTVTVRPISFAAWRSLSAPGAPYRLNFKDAVSLDIDGKVAVLRIDTFVNYREPVDPRPVYAALFERLRDAQVEVLVLDTRLNGGGSTGAMLALLTHFTEEPFRFQKARYVKTLDLTPFADVISTWDPSALKPDPNGFIREREGWYRVKPETNPLDLQPIAPASPTFKGHVIALSDASNASGVTMMLARLKELRSVEIVGEPTGGSAEGPTAGTLFFVELPNSKIRVRVPYYRQYLDVSSFEPGLGVTPDLAVTPTRADFFAGKDTVLDVALSRARALLDEKDTP